MSEIVDEPGIAVVKFRGQLQEVIAARFGEIGVPTTLVEGADLDDSQTLETLADENVKGIYLSGGKHSVNEPDAPTIPSAVLELGKPIMASCYGEQALAVALGGRVERGENEELGRTDIEVSPVQGSLLEGVEDVVKGLMSHKYVVTQAPPNTHVTAVSPAGIAAFEDPERNIHAFQWHVESPQTTNGRILFERFAEVCGVEPSQEAADNYVEKMLEKSDAEIVAAAQDGFIQAFLSGGVDSAVASYRAFKLLESQGLADKILFTYVDTGSMRENDLGTIQLLQDFGMPIMVLDKSELFLETAIKLPESEAKKLGYDTLPKLVDAKDGDTVRQIVKFGFLQVHHEIADRIRAEHGDVKVYLLQGTNAADIAESLGEIKKHHNQGVDEFVDDEILPLKRLFKGQIRKAGRDSGLPKEITERQPFPGPGQTIRVVPVTEVLDQHSDEFKATQADLAAYLKRINTNFEATLVPVRARGVRGDEKSDGFATVLHSPDGMVDYDELLEVSRTLGNEVTSVNRVGLSIGAVNPEQAQRSISLKRIRATFRLLRILEAAKDDWLDELGFEQELSQHFMALTDFSVDSKMRLAPSVWFRPFQSGGWGRENEDMMTGVAPLPGVEGFHDYGNDLRTLHKTVKRLGASGLILDTTPKPFGTTEWL